MNAAAAILSDLADTRDRREAMYLDFHRHPELSMREHRTSAKIREHLESYGGGAGGAPEIIPVGATGVVAVLRNGDGPVVAARADFDALPMQEESGKDYASVEPGVAHSCGHDVHVTALLGAVEQLARHRDRWRGTFTAIFQPGEETAEGARDMVAGGLVDMAPTPDVVLAQHVLGTIPGGCVGTRHGPVLSEAASIEIVIHGSGSHGSMPHLGVDPIVVGAAVVGRLQTLVSREVDPTATAVVTVGSFHGGTKSNIIPDSVTLLVNTRAYDSAIADHLHAGIERIVRAECDAARSPRKPEFRYYDRYPLTRNDDAATDRVRAAFAPDIHPTLDRGTEAIVVAAAAWLCDDPTPTPRGAGVGPS